MANYKILVIDYEPRGIQQLCVPLEMAGYTVELAKDGLAGIKKFEEFKPDLTLIEAMIPKKHGFEVCEQLKKTPHGTLTPIVIVTAVYKGRRYRTQALHHYRCDEYLEKPIEAEKLLEVVRRLLPESAEAPEATPETAKPAAAAPVAAQTQDDAELEIMSRLDEVLGDDSSTDTEKAAIEEPAIIKNEAEVLSFDPDRARAKRQSISPVVETRTGPTIQTRGSAAELPLPAEPVAQPEIRPRRSRPAPRPEVAPQSGGRLIWVLVGVVLGIVTSSLVFYLLRSF